MQNIALALPPSGGINSAYLVFALVDRRNAFTPESIVNIRNQCRGVFVIAHAGESVHAELLYLAYI